MLAPRTALLLCLLAACGGPDAVLRDHVHPAGLSLIGAAADADALGSEPRYAEVLGSEYNLVTPENVMKWAPTEPQPDAWTFGPADALVRFAQAHHMAV